MKTSELINEMQRAHKRLHLSWNTFTCYRGWTLRFIKWARNHQYNSDEKRVTAFLSGIAETSSESTQNQALNALVFMHKHGLKRPLGQLPSWTRAKRPKRLPVWVTKREAFTLFQYLKDEPLEMAQMMFGAGLRLTECLSLRIRDIDFDNCTITIRGGKGDKDRTTLLPKNLIDPLRARIRGNEYIWETDQQNRLPGVYLPDAVQKKYPNAGKEWAWFWLWPGKHISVDPETGTHRRHHVHKDTFAKATKVAVRRSKIGKKVSAHSFRHGFATAMLMSGVTIHEVQELLGHTSITTTEVYLHCLPRLTNRVESPLDSRPDIVPFSPVKFPQKKIAN